MAAETFTPRDGEDATRDIGPSDEPTSSMDEFGKQFGSDVCFFCSARKSPAGLEACERESPGRNCPKVGERR